MKLSQKDKEFLERLKDLIDEDALWIDARHDEPGRFVLRRNYGDQIERRFRMTRQGVRWRFHRLFNDIYVSAYETILFIEKQIGSQYRDEALWIAHDRFVARQRALGELGMKEANPYRGKNKD